VALVAQLAGLYPRLVSLEMGFKAAALEAAAEHILPESLAWLELLVLLLAVAVAVDLLPTTALPLVLVALVALVLLTSLPIADYDHRLKKHHLDSERRPLALDILRRQLPLCEP
jgi:Flp pilus assembly protein TadB